MGVGRGGSCSVMTALGDANRESGGDNGNSGKSSLNLDLVRLGTPELKLLRGVGGRGAPVPGTVVAVVVAATAEGAARVGA